MKSFRLAVLFCLAMCASSAFAYQGSMPQPGQTPQTSGAASQGMPSQNPEHPGATPPYAPPQAQRPDTSQNPGAQTPDAQTPQPSQSPAMHPGAPSIADQVKGLTTALNLTPDQQAKIKTIMEDQHGQVTDVVNDGSLSPDAKMQKARALRQQMIDKIRGTLTSDDQKTKFDNIVQASNERLRQREQQQPGSTPAPK